MNRLDVALTCYVAATKVIAKPLEAITRNVSRSGMLMRWDKFAPLPNLGKKMTVEIELPENSEFGPRVMQCQTTVVRIAERTGDDATVALKIRSIKFAPLRSVAPQVRDASDLATLPLPTLRTM